MRAGRRSTTCACHCLPVSDVLKRAVAGTFTQAGTTIVARNTYVPLPFTDYPANQIVLGVTNLAHSISHGLA